ncbi:CsbD family protein [Sanguibacter sp. HDW7]|uniref:CsbD family protein n=1 Tax=Sanguibacter sp. HDW7 TaxID=2714931 RepID=UPI00140957D1|nr:CsbD family protein [Sanguibacter sp. HDW7]QIK84654.1 CsbD family protein [Sanguibacter sp. HDW7]
MGIDDKIKNAAQGVEGDIKAAAGRATGDEKLEAEGRKEQIVSDLKQAGEKVKDAFRRD